MVTVLDFHPHDLGLIISLNTTIYLKRRILLGLYSIRYQKLQLSDCIVCFHFAKTWNEILWGSVGDVMKANLQEKSEEVDELNHMVSLEYYENWKDIQSQRWSGSG